jgi:hypothetical protein
MVGCGGMAVCCCGSRIDAAAVAQHRSSGRGRRQSLAPVRRKGEPPDPLAPGRLAAPGTPPRARRRRRARARGGPFFELRASLGQRRMSYQALQSRRARRSLRPVDRWRSGSGRSAAMPTVSGGQGSWAARGGNGDCLRLECRRLRAARKPLAALGLAPWGGRPAGALGPRSSPRFTALSVTRPPARAKEDPMNDVTVIWNGASFR